MIQVPRDDRSVIGQWWWTVDRWMLGVVGILIAIGVVVAFAASPAAAARMNIGDPFHFALELPGWKMWLGIVLVGLGAALVLFPKEEAAEVSLHV